VVGIREGKNISYPELSYSLLPIPSSSEQTAIANFLDEKTSKIDQAIAQKERVIELLKERKQIIIQNAVTGKTNCLNYDLNDEFENHDLKRKNHDPSKNQKNHSSRPMKDSGVEWIGEIPGHWEVKKLKYVSDFIQTGTTPSTENPDFFDGGINWFNPKDLNNEMLDDSKKTVSEKALKRNEIKMFLEDSVLIVGIGATTGKTAYMSNKGTFNQQITGFHSKKEHNKYLFYLLKSMARVMLNVASYTTLPILNNEFFKSFWIVIPSKNEQPKIVSHIETQSTKIDEAISQQQTQIEKLKEYKATLIDSAVTGKIKVS
jgi:type I restriction enzyme S subunit